jgi:hypothetical protein
MKEREDLIELIQELEQHPADFIPTWIEIRGQVEKLRLIVAALDGGDYTSEQFLEHSNSVLTDVRDFLLMEQDANELNILRQSILN